MRVHDHERPGAATPAASSPADEHDPAWQGAKRAAEAGHVHEASSTAPCCTCSGSPATPACPARRRRAEAASGRRCSTSSARAAGRRCRADVRGEMEAGLGADFGDVRVHDGGAAAASAQAVNAKAYTVGNDVVFNRGAYQPDTAEGRHTLAHELTHVVQQRSGPVDGTPTGDGVALSDPDDRFEREAEATATTLGRAETPAPSTARPDGAGRRRRAARGRGGGGGAGRRRWPTMPRCSAEGEDEEEMPAQAMAEEPRCSARARTKRRWRAEPTLCVARTRPRDPAESTQTSSVAADAELGEDLVVLGDGAGLLGELAVGIEAGHEQAPQRVAVAIDEQRPSGRPRPPRRGGRRRAGGWRAPGPSRRRWPGWMSRARTTHSAAPSSGSSSPA